jgi:transcriptional regulator with XRE-family HTH domain
MAVRTKRPYRVYLDNQRFRLEAEKREWKTNAQAADALGISEATLSKLLSRKIQPSAATIDCFINELDVSYGALFRREEMS